MGNQEGVDLFPRFSVKHLNKSTLDHVPVQVYWTGRVSDRGKKQFRYEKCWNLQEGCSEVVREGWEGDVNGSPHVSGH